MRYKILDEAKVAHLGEERSAVDHVLQPASSGKAASRFGQVGLVVSSLLIARFCDDPQDPIQFNLG